MVSVQLEPGSRPCPCITSGPRWQDPGAGHARLDREIKSEESNEDPPHPPPPVSPFGGRGARQSPALPQCWNWKEGGFSRGCYCEMSSASTPWAQTETFSGFLFPPWPRPSWARRKEMDRRRRWWVGAHGREGTREGRQGWPRRRGRQRVRNTVSELYIHTYKPKSVYTT